MARFLIIVNPIAGKGNGAIVAPIIREQMTALGADFSLVHTQGPGHAIRLASEAAADGYDTVVAVGGDGTSHEVVNGLLAHPNGSVAGTLGCIPAGSGNDFAVMNGTPTDIVQACRVLVAGGTHLVDVGQVIIDGRVTRFFDNAVGIGFDALVVRETLRHQRLRGMALYVPVVLKTVFVDLQAPRLTVTCDGQRRQVSALMAVIANGPREGGSFHVVPHARPDDGYLDLLIAQEMPRLHMLALIPQFIKGTHLPHPRISTQRVRHVTITSEDPLFVHVDGEILTDEAHRIEAVIMPQCLRMVAPLNGA